MCVDGGILVFFFFFFNDTATTEIYTLSLHDALPIYSKFYIDVLLYHVGLFNYGHVQLKFILQGQIRTCYHDMLNINWVHDRR